ANFFFCIYFLSIFYTLQSSVELKPENSRKKIVVITCKGGGGHQSATRTLFHYLGEEYEIKPIVLLEEILGSLDPIRKFTFDKYTCEDFYNYSLRKGWNYLINNLVAPIGSSRIVAWQEQIEQLAFEHIKKINPDLIISVMPFFNAGLLNVARKLEIPFLIITTDLDSSNYVIGIS